MTVIPQPKQMDRDQATWDAWNRLVKLEDDEETVAQYAYDARRWRIKKLADEETRHFYYSSAWQCLEERIDTSSDADRQHVWGLRYIDDLVLRDRHHRQWRVGRTPVRPARRDLQCCDPA